MKRNPFSVTTPETMTAEEIVKLFVQSAPNFQLYSDGHMFIHGHRGSGKSMAFRLLSPDCQLLIRQQPLSQHPFFAVYATVKATELDLHEFARIQEESSGLILAEHLLVTFFIGKCVRCLQEIRPQALNEKDSFSQLKSLIQKFVLGRLHEEGLPEADFESVNAAKDAAALLGATQQLLDQIHVQTIRYLRKRGISNQYVAYTGPLLGFQDFLLPFFRNLKSVSALPQGPVYLLVDDADNLNLLQTLVLNTWVSYRTTHEVSLKISTQLRYKTYSTTSGNRIETPHDYTETDAFSIFTGGNHDKYPHWVKAIVEKRLSAYGIAKVTAEQFFPPDEEQEKAIRRIAEEFKAKWATSGSGNRPGDDAYRYARPEYIKNLGGTSKGSHNYKYAGFEQLVHISSGIIRHFLDAAAKMYAKEVSRKALSASDGNDGSEAKEVPVTSISPAIQDDVVRTLADELMDKEFTKLFAESDPITGSRNIRCTSDDLLKLKTLIKSLGGIFYECLVSDRSERRVLTFALSNIISARVEKVIRLGVENGYFYESYVGSKDGRSRTKRYVLTRRVAPYFKLDPTGFSGYLFVSANLLEMAVDDDIRTIEFFRKTRLADSSSIGQSTLFGEEDHASQN